MKTIGAALQQGIEDGTVATCIKITRKDAVVKGFTNHDVYLTVDAVVYSPTPALQRVIMNMRNNAEVSNQEFVGAWVVDLDDTDLTNGLYDDATIEVFKVDWSNVGAGSVAVFVGNLGLIQWTEDGFRADIHSTMKQLARPIGVQVTAKCRHQLFEVNGETNVGFCGVTKAPLTYTATVTTIVNQKLEFDHSTISQVDGWVANGIVTWTSGSNNGASGEVKDFTSDTITLFLPTIFTIQVGDTFEVTAGCDKAQTTCQTKFSNGINFGGFPHIRNEINFK